MERLNHKEKLRIFSHYLLVSRDGGRAGNGVNNWSCLYDEASMKIPKYRVQRAYGVHPYWEGDTPQIHRHRSSCTWNLPKTAPCLPLHLTAIWIFIIPFNILVNISISLSSGSCCSKLIEPEEGAWDPPIQSNLTEVVGIWGLTTCNWYLKWYGSSLGGLCP